MPQDTEGNDGQATTPATQPVNSSLSAAIGRAVEMAATETTTTGGQEAEASTTTEEEAATETADESAKAEGTDEAKQADGIYEQFELDPKPFESIKDPAERKAVWEAAQKRWAEQTAGLARKDAQRQRDVQEQREAEAGYVNTMNALLDPKVVMDVLPIVFEHLAEHHQKNGLDILAALKPKQTVPDKDVEDMTHEELAEFYKEQGRKEVRGEAAVKKAEPDNRSEPTPQDKRLQAFVDSEAAILIPLFAKLHDGFEITRDDVEAAAKAYPPQDPKAGLAKSLEAHLSAKLIEHKLKTLSKETKAPEMPTQAKAAMGAQRPDFAKLNSVKLDHLDLSKIITK